MFLSLALAVLLAVVPYPRQVRSAAFSVCLAAALILVVGGTVQIVVYRGDGVLMGGVCLVIALVLGVRALLTRRALRVSL
jgi:hypothetical protein